MNIRTSKLVVLTIIALTVSSCVSKKNFIALQDELSLANTDLGKCGESLNDYMTRLSACQQEKQRLIDKLEGESTVTIKLKDEQIADLRTQLDDCRQQRDKQVEAVGDLTVLSQSASENIKETLSQLENKDKYINLLQAARTKADSINLALAVNLKGVLSQGIADQDVNIQVDKTVVFINLSDKMLYQSGSSKLTPRAFEVLSKIAKIIESKPDLEVMVEGYTDNDPIKTSCLEDNWDLSVKRSTSVVRVLQKNYGIDPNRLIAAGRGEYNTLAPNTTPDGKSMNRRTRIIILPKLNEFYDLLNPDNAN